MAIARKQSISKFWHFTCFFRIHATAMVHEKIGGLDYAPWAAIRVSLVYGKKRKHKITNGKETRKLLSMINWKHNHEIHKGSPVDSGSLQ